MSNEQKDIYTSDEYFEELEHSKEGPFGGQECLKQIGENERLFKPQDGDKYQKMINFPIFLFEDDKGKHYCFSDDILENIKKEQNNIKLREDKIPINFIKELDEQECEVEKNYHNSFLENVSYSPFKNLITMIYNCKKIPIIKDSYRIYSISHKFVYNTNFDLVDITDMLSIFFLNSVQDEITLQKMLEQRNNYKYGCLTVANSKDIKRKIDDEHEYAIHIRETLVNLYEKVKDLIEDQAYVERLLNTIYNLLINKNLNLKHLKDLKIFISKIQQKNFKYVGMKDLYYLIQNLEKLKEEETKVKEEQERKLKEEEERIIKQKLKEEEEKKQKKLKKIKQEEERKVKQEEESMLQHFYNKYEVIENFMETNLDIYTTNYLFELDSRQTEIDNLSFLYKVLLRLKYRLKKILNDYKYKNIYLETIDLKKIEEEQRHIRDTFDNIFSIDSIKNIEKIDKKTYENILQYKQKSLENINKYKGKIFIFDTILFQDLGKNEIENSENIVKKYISFHKKSFQLKGKALIDYKLNFTKTPLEEIDEYFKKFFNKLFIKYLYLETQKYISNLIKELNNYPTKDLNLLEDEEYQLTLLEISILLDQLLSPFLLSQNLFSLKITDKILENNFKEYLKYIQKLRQSLSIMDINESIYFLDDIQDKLGDNFYKKITGKDYNFSDNINRTLKVLYNLFKTLKKDEQVYHPVSHEVKMKLKEQIEKKIKESEPDKIDKSSFISYLSLIFMEYFYDNNKNEITDYLSAYSNMILKDYQSYLQNNYLK